MEENISPYLVIENQDDPFLRKIATLQNGYFWASVMELGTGIDRHLITLPEQGVSYFLTEPTNEGCIAPEDMLQLLFSHEENKLWWGYSWTIHEMAATWNRFMERQLPEQSNPRTDDYAIKTDFNNRCVSIVPKELVWKIVQDIQF